MKLQIAIDRVDVDTAVTMIGQVVEWADIIEVGTSLIKDFGLANSVGFIKEKYPYACILGDIKTCDEGAYEFQKGYEAGADISTVMGFSSLATIRSCADVAAEYQKEYMIDLLEVSEERLAILIKEFPEAIFGVHLPFDQGGEGLVELLTETSRQLSGVKQIAVAGGVTLPTLPMMKKAGVEIVIVGGAITKADDLGAAAKAFKEAIL